MQRKRLGIFGWGLVAPKSPNVRAFEENLMNGGTWLEPFKGFGPSNFLVGNPDFDFRDYKAWIDAHFEPRKFSQLDAKMGRPVKYAIGSFIQALEQNEKLYPLLSELGDQVHVYVGTGLGDLPTTYRASLDFHKALRRWNRFWCKPENHPELKAYREADETAQDEIRNRINAPKDPKRMSDEEWDYGDVLEEWFAFWVDRSEPLARYLARLAEIEGESLGGDVDSGKGHVLRRKMAARKRLNQEAGCPVEPWGSVGANLLWNIPNIAAAQITMLAGIKGQCVAPMAACAGFISSLKLADMAIQSGEAKIAVIGMTDPPPHPLTVSAFFNARVISNDGEISKPFTGMRGTHIAGGACVWIVGDLDYLVERGLQPIGMEIVGMGLTSDAHHIITPNKEGPRAAIAKALETSKASSEDIETWDMHATATPGDWTELKNLMEILPDHTRYTARKGTMGHGMSVCGGWELTAQHMGSVTGRIFPVALAEEEVHPLIREHADRLVQHPGSHHEDGLAGKINMGVGGVNGCIICRPYEES